MFYNYFFLYHNTTGISVMIITQNVSKEYDRNGSLEHYADSYIIKKVIIFQQRRNTNFFHLKYLKPCMNI